MARTTNNFDRKIDFISAIADLADPFNSTLLESYPEYRKDLSAYLNDEKECFVSILNKVGQDGCEVLYDRVVNYIDDISNIDTTIPSALLSQANAIGYPYKDKKIVDQLDSLTKCMPLLQNIIWAVSTNFRNSKIIAERLGLATESELSSDEITSTDSLNDELSAGIYSVFDNILEKKYLYLDENDNVSDISAPRMIDFSWMINEIYHDKILNDNSFSNNIDNRIIVDFGKYNYSLYSIICYQAIIDKLYTLQSIDDSSLSKNFNKVEYLSKLARKAMPYLYDSSKFDPIQAAWSIIFNNATIDDYDKVYHEDIKKMINVFSKLNTVSESEINNSISDNEEIASKNIKFIPRLNANSFVYQQLITQFIHNIKKLFGIDIQEYIEGICCEDDGKIIMNGDYKLSLQSSDTHGFCYIDYASIDFDSYLRDIIYNIFDLGKKIRILREDMRVMTLRNSYKGTAALIQFSTIEYLKECIGDIITQSQAKYMSELSGDELSSYKKSDSYLKQSDIDNILKFTEITSLDQSDIGVIEYWDYTEYFGRVDGSRGFGSPVDWSLIDEKTQNSEIASFIKYGSTTDKDILEFYKNVLHLPSSILNGFTNESDQLHEVKKFLKAVYNSGVFTTRTDSNYEAIYSGNKDRTTSPTPWINYKNDRDANPYISKEIHPYIWNFANKILTFLYDSGAVTQSIQNAEYELLMNHIGIIGNLIDQYRLSKNFVDSSGYVTRYEHRDHGAGEIAQSYDGIVYPKFAYWLTEDNRYGISSQDEIDRESFQKNFDDHESLYQEWYIDQTLSLTEHGIDREISNLKDEFDNISSYVHNTEVSSNALQYYCIDKFETTYALNPNTNTYYYKENGYPFMRRLIHFDGNGENLGMLFIDADGSIITSSSQLSCEEIYDSYNISADKFPPLYMSEDGSHMLIRLNKNLIGSFIVTTHRNSVNEIEKALQVNAFIKCDDIVFSEEFYNDSLIKSVDDDFYILVQRKDSSHEAYLFYIRKKSEAVKVRKQQIDNAKDTVVKSGLFLNNGQKIIINTFLFNEKLTTDYFDRSTALDRSKGENDLDSNGITDRKNYAEISSSSYDVIDKFIQLYASSEFGAQDSKDFSLIKIDKTNKAYPSVDLQLDSIQIKEDSFLDKSSIDENSGFFKRNLWTSIELPFTRVFNINSDAGFNPIYIGELGKIILENRDKQFKYVKTIGGAFQLLGPENDFEDDTPPDPGDNPEISSDDDLNDIAFVRIHELYSETIDNFDKEKLGGKFADYHPYINGYASIVENNECKDGMYGIDSIGYCVLSAVGDNYVSGEVRELSSKSTLSAYSRLYLFIGSGNRLYSVIPRRKTTLLQDTSDEICENTLILNALLGTGSEYEMRFNKSYVIKSLKFGNRSISAYGNFHELVNAEIYLVNVVSNEGIESPNFMLPQINLTNAIDDISSDLIDAHMRVPHMSVTQSYEEVAEGKESIKTDLSSFAQGDILSGSLTEYGSLVFSLTEVDSEMMNRNGFEDQEHGYSLKSVTPEIMNDFYRRKDLNENHNGDFSTLDYSFKPFSFTNMNMERDISDGIVPGYEISDSTSNDEKYIIQPYHDSIAIHQDNANKYTISFWRVPEKDTRASGVADMIENVLPKNVKVVEHNTRGENSYPPVYSHEHESIDKLIKDAKFIPKLCVQWRYHGGNKGDPIELKFTNAAAYDSVFRNDNNGCEYISLSDLGESLTLMPGNQDYIDIVAPNHIQVGFTVFYNIPIMRALVTNISDDKPKFMLTILNDKTGSSTNISVNNYALVFITNSTPQLSNSDMTYIQCYVAPLNSIDQPSPPSIQNAIVLSELAFNFDVSNILNANEKQLFTANDIDLVTKDNRLSETASSNVYYDNNVHQVRMYDVPIESKNSKTKYAGFVVADIKIDFNGLSEFHLKNSIATAHGEVTAIDANGNKCQIIKVYGISLDRIGLKNVLGVTKDSVEYVGTVTQNSGRKTAIQLVPPENQGF